MFLSFFIAPTKITVSGLSIVAVENNMLLISTANLHISVWEDIQGGAKITTTLERGIEEKW